MIFLNFGGLRNWLSLIYYRYKDVFFIVIYLYKKLIYCYDKIFLCFVFKCVVCVFYDNGEEKVWEKLFLFFDFFGVVLREKWFENVGIE